MHTSWEELEPRNTQLNVNNSITSATKRWCFVIQTMTETSGTRGEVRNPKVVSRWHPRFLLTTDTRQMKKVNSEFLPFSLLPSTYYATRTQKDGSSWTITRLQKLFESQTNMIARRKCHTSSWVRLCASVVHHDMEFQKPREPHRTWLTSQMLRTKTVSCAYHWGCLVPGGRNAPSTACTVRSWQGSPCASRARWTSLQ